MLTSPRTVEVITGPAGTGKTRVLAAIARAWDGPVFGTATSQNATNELRAAGIRVAANTTRLLADLQHGRIPPGSLILADEGSMISITHLAALTEYAARNRCKLVLAGDQEQLAAVEGGGAMMLLADRLGYVQLAEPVRFTAAWERAASLRLRHGDATALDEYDQHGRIRGAPPDQAIDQAARAYVATYLTGRNVLLMAADWARCRELSRRIRDDLIHLGLVDDGRTIRIADGAEASAGDLIICRANDHRLEAGEPGRALANGDVLRIEAITRRGIMVRRLLDPDPATGQRRFTDRAFRYDRLPVIRPRLRGHRALRPGRHRAHRHRAGHRHRGPAVAVPGDDPRHRRQPRLRVHHPGPARRPAARHPARPRTRPLRPHPPRTRRIPATTARPAPSRAGRTSASRSPCSPTSSAATAPNCPPPRSGSATWPTPTTSPPCTRSGPPKPRAARHDRYRDLVTAALPPGHRQPLSHQARWLFRTLHAAELAGLDPAEVIRTAIASRDLAGSRDIAAVLDARIRPRVDPLLPQPQGPWTGRVPQAARPGPPRLPGPDRRDDGRPHPAPGPAHRPDRPRLGDPARSARCPPTPAARQRLGAQGRLDRRLPGDVRLRPSRRPDRPRTQPPSTRTSGPPGTRPSPPSARPADPDVRAMPDGRLWLLRDTYAAETAWAPRHVGKELRLSRLGAFDAALGAIRADAEADAARKAGDHDRAARHEHLAASYRALRDHYQQQEQALAQAMADRQEWEQATAGSRRLAIAADAELRRRHPDRKIEPLRSASQPPSAALNASTRT